MATIKKFLKKNHVESLDLPFEMKINFSKAFRYWEAFANDTSHPKASYAKSILDQVKDADILRNDVHDFDMLSDFDKEISLLLSDFFPEALGNNEIKAVTIPFTPLFFNPTKRFERLMANTPDEFEIEMKGVDFGKMYIYAGTFLMNALFGAGMDYKRPFFLEIPNKDRSLIRHYRVFLNADFADFQWNDEFPKPTAEQIKVLKDSVDNIELWKEVFPKGSASVNGFTIMVLQDVTTDVILSNIKNLLIKKDSLQNKKTIEDLEQQLRDYLSLPDLKFGFSFFDLKEGKINAVGRENSNSLLMSDTYAKDCDNLFCEHSYDMVFNSYKPIAISELNIEPIKNIGFAQNLIKQNINSYIVVPIRDGDQIIGLFELGSSGAGNLHSILTEKLQDVVPLFTVAMSRMREEYYTKLEALIQEKYTAIHPSVEWKFFEEAAAYLENPDEDVKDISFTDVYPLYAQSDIKGSSTIRNDSIQKDLIIQLKLVKEIINKASMQYGFPIYEVLIHKIDNYINSVNENLNAGDEVKVLSFFKYEINSTLEHLRKNHSDLEADIVKYHKQLDPQLGLIYEKRKDFDDSVTKLNEGVAKVLSKSQDMAQDMFPHYFQHYKTDGVEYNIYAGSSLVKGKEFDKIHLKNLRMWQLITTYRIEKKVHKMRKKLPIPLEICSLILVHSSPLAIKFRMDEKQFDVDGAYNIRYEIVKKRIDKAYIKDTNDRLTVPGKIAIVYSQEQDREEYMVFLEYLNSINMITDEIETLELEDLKGASGLKALRVTINFGEESKGETEDINNLIEELGKN
jgi:hypothetical protein